MPHPASALDRVIACLLRNVDDVQRSMAQSEVVKSSVEDTQNTFESVGMEGRAAEAAAMADWVEEIQSQLLQIESQIQSQIPFAESLKTAGGGAAPGGNTTGPDTASEPVATTGADPTPNPVHATPAHTREPSEKIGDPVKPVETEPPRHVGLSRKRKLGRKAVDGADDIKSMAEEFSEPIGNLDQVGVDPYGPEIRTETVVSQPPAQFQSQHVDPGVTDFVGTAVMMSAAVFEAGGRLWESLKEKRKND